MIGLLRRSGAAFRRFAKNTCGSASVEFAVAFPFLCFFLFGFGEVGTMTTRAVMLERGLDIAIRDVRIGNIPRNISAANQREIIKFDVCREAFLLASCVDELVIELQAVPLGNDIPNDPIDCLDRARPADEVAPPDANINLGTVGSADDELMIVRACVVVNPVFPLSGWFAGTPLPNGDFALFAQTAFLNEP